MFFAINKSHWLGVGLFVLATFAVANRQLSAGIVFRELNVTLDSSMGMPFDLDVDLNGTIDFTFTSTFVPDPVLAVGFNQVEFPFGSNNGVVIDATVGDGFPTVSRLSLGDTVSSGSLYSFPTDRGNLSFFTTVDPPSGNFAGRTGFVGLKFDRLGGTAFGFAQISVNPIDAPLNPFGLTLHYVAFNDTLGELATITAVPEPSSITLAGISLGLLAAFHRRKKHGNTRKTPLTEEK